MPVQPSGGGPPSPYDDSSVGPMDPKSQSSQASFKLKSSKEDNASWREFVEKYFHSDSNTYIDSRNRKEVEAGLAAMRDAAYGKLARLQDEYQQLEQRELATKNPREKADLQLRMVNKRLEIAEQEPVVKAVDVAINSLGTSSAYENFRKACVAMYWPKII